MLGYDPPTSPSTPAEPLRTSRVIRQVPFFYGWVILVAGTLCIIMMGPSQSFNVSLFIDSFVADLGISRSNVSLLYGLATLGASLLLPVTGRLVDRYGTRRMILGTSLALGLSLISVAWVTGPLSLFLAMLAVRFLGFGSTQLVSNNVIAQWFVRRRGLVMGIAGQSLGISLLIYPALSNRLIQELGWRQAWIALGILSLGILLPVGWTFFRDRPELYGLKPDGNLPPPASGDQDEPEIDWTLEEARRTGIFWLFAAAFTAITMILAGLVLHQASLFAEQGLDRSTLVFAFQVTAVFSILGNLGFGYLLDRASPRRLLLAQMLGLIGTLLLVQRMTGWVGVTAYAALNGLTSGSMRVMDGTVWAKYFGRRYLGAIRGATMLGTVGGTAFGPYPLGLSYDLTGSYSTALIALLILPLSIAIMSFWVKRPAAHPAASNSVAGGSVAGDEAHPIPDNRPARAESETEPKQ